VYDTSISRGGFEMFKFILEVILWAFLWTATCYISFNMGIAVTATSVAKVLKETVKVDITVHFIFAVITFLGCVFLLATLK